MKKLKLVLDEEQIRRCVEKVVEGDFLSKNCPVSAALQQVFPNASSAGDSFYTGKGLEAEGKLSEEAQDFMDVFDENFTNNAHVIKPAEVEAECPEESLGEEQMERLKNAKNVFLVS